MTTTKLKSARGTTDLEAPVYSAEGKKTGSLALSEKVFGAKWNADLVHQVITAMRANARQPIAHVKERGEVSGGGKKPWRQKGTGRARHGSTRSPIWRHGGVTHGPRNERDFSQKINRKMRVKALYAVLSKKYAAGEMLFLSDFAFKAPQTKIARETLNKLGSISGYEGVATRRKNAIYLVLGKSDANVKKSFQNMSNVLVGNVQALNPVDVLTYKYVLFVDPEESVKVIGARSK